MVADADGTMWMMEVMGDAARPHGRMANRTRDELQQRNLNVRLVLVGKMPCLENGELLSAVICPRALSF